MNAQSMRIIRVLRPPNFGEQLPMRKHAIRIEHHVTQKIVFLRRQMHFFIVDYDFPVNEINQEPAAFKAAFLRLLLLVRDPPEYRSNSRKQLSYSERLCEVIVSTFIKSVNLVVL